MQLQKNLRGEGKVKLIPIRLFWVDGDLNSLLESLGNPASLNPGWWSRAPASCPNSLELFRSHSKEIFKQGKVTVSLLIKGGGE